MESKTETTKPKQKTKEMQVVKKETQGDVMNLISMAIMEKVPVETLERLFALQREYKADKAREEFMKAVASFQGDVGTIGSDKRVLNKDGKTIRYQYASLGHIAEEIRKPLQNNNLAYSWDVVHENSHMRVVAKLTHSLGHSETSTFEIPISQDQYMTEPQKYASAQTYAKRYTLINALGLATADEDTDATDVGKEPEVKSQKARIMFLLRSLGEKEHTKQEVQESVKKITKLTLEEKNYGEIAKRLEAALKEQMEKESEIPVINA